ncbi:hypothetical protein IFM89_011692, partial [Coptis chinensis]
AAILTFEASSEMSEFARKWVPFYKKFNIEPRSPEWYFSQKIDYLKDKVHPNFVRDRRAMKVFLGQDSVCDVEGNELPRLVSRKKNRKMSPNKEKRKKPKSRGTSKQIHALENIDEGNEDLDVVHAACSFTRKLLASEMKARFLSTANFLPVSPSKVTDPRPEPAKLSQDGAIRTYTFEIMLQPVRMMEDFTFASREKNTNEESRNMWSSCGFIENPIGFWDLCLAGQDEVVT